MKSLQGNLKELKRGPIVVSPDAPNDFECEECGQASTYRRLGDLVWRRMLCRCELERREQDEQEAAEEAHKLSGELIAESLADLNIPHKFRRLSLRTLERDRHNEVAYDALETWVREAWKEPCSLYLLGRVGRGKTSAIAAALTDLAKSGQLVIPGSHATNWSRYAAYFVETHEYLKLAMNFESQITMEKADRFRNAAILAIDDIGVEGATETRREYIYGLVNTRYTSSKPTLITSNCSLDVLERRLGDRVASRIAEMCVEHELTGPDRRVR